ncbi:MAG: hypothetical protein AAFV45_11855 [Pseudomonadota bacterium]
MGIVFWHAVGFWTFVSNAVFSGPREQIASRTTSTALRQAPITTGSVRGQAGSTTSQAAATTSVNPFSPARPLPIPEQTPNGKHAATLTPHAGEPDLLPTGTLNCADLALDRQTGSTWSGACDTASSAAQQQPTNSAQQRGDRLSSTQPTTAPTSTGWATAVEPSR